HLKPILSNLKYVDLIARYAGSSSQLSSLSTIGETDVIDWIWKQLVGEDDGSAARSSFLLYFAEKQTRSGVYGVPISDFSPSDSLQLNSLFQSKILIEE